MNIKLSIQFEVGFGVEKPQMLRDLTIAIWRRMVTGDGWRWNGHTRWLMGSVTVNCLVVINKEDEGNAI